MGVKIPWIGGSRYHAQGFYIPWVAEVKTPWIGDQNTMGRGFDVPCLGVTIPWVGEGVNIAWIGGSIYLGQGGQNTMGMEFSMRWVGGQNTMGGGESQNNMDRGS